MHAQNANAKGVLGRMLDEVGAQAPPFKPAAYSIAGTLCGTKSGSRAYSRIVVQAPRRPFTRSVEFPKVALLAHRTRTWP